MPPGRSRAVLVLDLEEVAVACGDRLEGRMVDTRRFALLVHLLAVDRDQGIGWALYDYAALFHFRGVLLGGRPRLYGPANHAAHRTGIHTVTAPAAVAARRFRAIVAVVRSEE